MEPRQSSESLPPIEDPAIASPMTRERRTRKYWASTLICCVSSALILPEAKRLTAGRNSRPIPKPIPKAWASIACQNFVHSETIKSLTEKRKRSANTRSGGEPRNARDNVDDAPRC